MKYLVLGASGFLGRKIVESILKDKSHTLRLFDRTLSPNSDCMVEKILGEFNKNTNFFELTKNVDVVYHLISTTIPSSKIKTTQEVEDNLIPTLQLLDACVENKVKKIIFISSGGTVYGEYLGRPFKEIDSTNPINSYGIQKLTIEKYIQLYGYQYQLDYRIIRLANPYGVGQNPLGSLGVVTKFVYNNVHELPITVFGDGNIIRDYIYIDDAIQGIFDIEFSEGKEKLYNLGMGEGHSILQIIDIIEKVTGKNFKLTKVPSRNVDVPICVLDINQYKKISSLKRMITLKEGITQMVRNYESGEET